MRRSCSANPNKLSGSHVMSTINLLCRLFRSLLIVVSTAQLKSGHKGWVEMGSMAPSQSSGFEGRGALWSSARHRSAWMVPLPEVAPCPLAGNAPTRAPDAAPLPRSDRTTRWTRSGGGRARNEHPLERSLGVASGGR